MIVCFILHLHEVLALLQPYLFGNSVRMMVCIASCRPELSVFYLINQHPSKEMRRAMQI